MVRFLKNFHALLDTCKWKALIFILWKYTLMERSNFKIVESKREWILQNILHEDSQLYGYLEKLPYM